MLGWARRSIDLIPTSWMITGAGAILLAATAVFGGLNTAPVDPIPQVAVGTAFAGSDLEMTVRGVELRDDRGALAVFPNEDKGERILAVTVDVVNTFSSPRKAIDGATTAGASSPAVDGIRIEGVDVKGEVHRADDGKSSPMLQPDVPARLVLTWIVGPDDFHDGDEITLTLPDSTHYVGTSVVRGDYWDDVRVGATVPATIEEAGA